MNTTLLGGHRARFCRSNHCRFEKFKYPSRTHGTSVNNNGIGAVSVVATVAIPQFICNGEFILTSRKTQHACRVHSDIFCVLGTFDDGFWFDALIGECPRSLHGEIICIDLNLNIHSITTERRCRSRWARTTDIVNRRKADTRRRERDSRLHDSTSNLSWIP